MYGVRAFLAASLLFASTACVAQDGNYGSGYGGYSSGYDSYGNPYGGGYGAPVYGGYAAPTYGGYGGYGSPTVHCNLPGRDVNTTPGDCRQLQRRYGVSENDAARRSGQVYCQLPGEDTYTTPEDCRRRQRAAGGRSESEVARRTIHCNLPGNDVNTTPEDCRRRQQAAGGRSEREVQSRSGGRVNQFGQRIQPNNTNPVSE